MFNTTFGITPHALQRISERTQMTPTEFLSELKNDWSDLLLLGTEISDSGSPVELRWYEAHGNWVLVINKLTNYLVTIYPYSAWIERQSRIKFMNRKAKHRKKLQENYNKDRRRRGFDDE
jgi:hypothetical protein